jgi:predicted transcriptional regulator
MDKVLSARVDESAAALLDALARKLGRSKKSILEDALRGYAQHIQEGESLDLVDETRGTWQRKESPAATVRAVRSAFRTSLKRRAS